VQVLIPPDGPTGKQRKGWTGGRYTWMRYVLNSALGESLYRKRKHMIEPVFGHTRHNRGVTRFLRRGRTAVRTEWRLLMMTHNLTKLHRHQIATGGPETAPPVVTPPTRTGPSPTPLSAPSDASDRCLVLSDSLLGQTGVSATGVVYCWMSSAAKGPRQNRSNGGLSVRVAFGMDGQRYRARDGPFGGRRNSPSLRGNSKEVRRRWIAAESGRGTRFD